MRTWLAVLALFVLLAVGCENKEVDAWFASYDGAVVTQAHVERCRQLEFDHPVLRPCGGYVCLWCADARGILTLVEMAPTLDDSTTQEYNNNGKNNQTY